MGRQLVICLILSAAILFVRQFRPETVRSVAQTVFGAPDGVVQQTVSRFVQELDDYGAVDAFSNLYESLIDHAGD